MTDRVDQGSRDEAAAAVWWSGSDGRIAGLLGGVGYLAGAHACGVLRLAGQLGKPVLVEGPAGAGKTALATSLAAATGSRLIRLQCHEGLDEAKALYEWNHSKQLLRIVADEFGHGGTWADTGVFTEEFLLTRPLLDAIRADDPVVLLIDEVDRLGVEAEALLLEVLSDYQVLADAGDPASASTWPGRSRRSSNRSGGGTRGVARRSGRRWSGPGRCSRWARRTWTPGWPRSRCRCCPATGRARAA